MSSREKFKTYGNVFDEFTLRTLEKLRTEHHFDELESTIAVGKEANLFSAKKGSGRVMIKIYRINACDFNKMYDYIKEDPRYQNLRGKKRQIIFSWVQREFRNLMKAREAGVNVPLPITFKNNVLVLELIGNKNSLAPQLKNQKPKNPADFLKKIVENMKKMYKAELVHADLSPFNILNFEEKPVFIDFSQTTTAKNTRAEEFLQRDVRIIVQFFKKLGLKVSEEEMIKEIKNKYRN